MYLRVNLIQDNFPLNPKRPKDVQLLIGFLVRFKLKSITLKIIRGGGSGFLSSSFLNHDSKSRNEKQNKKKTQNQGKTALEKVRAQNITINNNICDACNECTYDACSNAQKARSIFQHSFN